MFGMAAADGALLFSVASVVEDVLQQHGTRSADLDLESRKAEEAGTFFLRILPSLLPICIEFVVSSYALVAEKSGRNENRIGSLVFRL